MIPDDLWLRLLPFTAEKGARLKGLKVHLLSQSSPVLTRLCSGVKSAHRWMRHIWCTVTGEKMSKREKLLILLFVLMTGVCVGLVAIYFANKANAPTIVEGECETCAVYQRGRWRAQASQIILKGPNITVISLHDCNVVIWSSRCNLHPQPGYDCFNGEQRRTARAENGEGENPARDSHRRLRR